MAIVESMKTLGEVLTELLERGLLDDEGLSLIKQHLAKRQPYHGEPWFVKFLLAIGAWVAAICFVTCLGIADLIDDDWWTLFGWGVAFVVAATVLRRVSDHIFPVQLALAVSSMGHGFVIAGLPYAFQGQMRIDEVSGGSPYGATTIAGGDGSRMPSENELEAARFQGKHVASIAAKLSN